MDLIIQSFPKLLNATKLTIELTLISLFIGSENLISLKRILEENEKLYDVFNNVENFKEIDFLNVCPSDTKQWHILTKKKLEKKKSYINYGF